MVTGELGERANKNSEPANLNFKTRKKNLILRKVIRNEPEVKKKKRNNPKVTPILLCRGKKKICMCKT